MHEIVQDGKRVILRGSGQELRLTLNKQGITDLECTGLTSTQFDVSANPLTTLKGSPQFTGASTYNASACRLDRLECPDLEVTVFSIRSNKRLKSLRGGPRSVQDYSAVRCDLRSLDCEELECVEFNVSSNEKLGSLRGGPKVAPHYWAAMCGLTSIEFETVYHDLHVEGNPLRSLRGLRQGATVRIDAGVPTLFAVGLDATVYVRPDGANATSLEDRLELMPTVFRTKLHLLRTDHALEAQFER